MIIPPDPEKDPRLFRESTASLVTVPEAQLVDVDSLIDVDAPALPRAAYTPNPAQPVAYPYGSGPFAADAFSIPFDPVPPYSARSQSQLDPVEHAAYGGAGAPLGRSFSRASRGSTSSSSTASASSATSINATPARRRYQILRGAGSSARATSTSRTSSEALARSGSDLLVQSQKPWEGLQVGSPTRRRWLGIPLPPRSRPGDPPETSTLWQKYRKWWIALLVVFAVGIVLAAGLAAGLVLSSQRSPKDKGRGDLTNPSRKGQNGSSYPTTPDMSITFEPERDGPKPEDGHASNCNQFRPLNSTSALTMLAVNSPYFAHYITTFRFPFDGTHNDMAALEHDLYVIARGLAATGTVEIIGSNAPPEVIAGGEEGVLMIDVLARYLATEDLTEIAQVCQLTRADGSAGVGIFTPTETDGGTEGPYMLDPVTTPAFHVIIRMPPSLLTVKNDTVGYLPSLSLELAQMGTRIGNLEQVMVIGDLHVTAGCRGGGVVVDYVSCETCTIIGSENTVQGTFNVSESLKVNSTSGTILANVILTDPQQPWEDSATITSTIPMPHGTRKRSVSGHSSDLHRLSKADRQSSGAQLDTQFVPDHLINTSFTTNEGFIFIAFLHHPPNTALRSWVSSRSGMVDVSMHPNYVGPFALENMWGAVRLPPVMDPASHDPRNLGRTRVVLQGAVDVNSTSFNGPANQDDEEITAPNSVTGAAAWVDDKLPMPSVSDIQNGFEGRGSALVAVANLGDLQVTFDGT